MALSRFQRLAATAVVIAGIGLSGCGDDDGDTGTPSATTTSIATTSPTTAAPATTAAPPTTTDPATGRVFEYTFNAGEVTSGENRVTVKRNEVITIRVVSDVAEEVHVHTYDRSADLEPGVPGDVTFVTDIPGVHEVELEDSHLHLLSLEVQ